ncbi:MAG TPA: DUF1416 domain-containing protein [Candidatus Eisenbacteria bacterium]|nr:DUF1416 domain-containing protein [Candidatus Eisenbacteria bacterium]
MSRESTIRGRVTRQGRPLEGAYLSLQGASGEFVGGIRTDETGRFQFYAAPGAWTLAVQVAGSSQTHPVTLVRGDDRELEVEA